MTHITHAKALFMTAVLLTVTSTQAGFYTTALTTSTNPQAAFGPKGAKVVAIHNRDSGNNETLFELRYPDGSLCKASDEYVSIKRTTNNPDPSIALREQAQLRDFTRMLTLAFVNNRTMRVHLYASTDLVSGQPPAGSCRNNITWVHIHYCNADQSPCID